MRVDLKEVKGLRIGRELGFDFSIDLEIMR